MKATRQNTMTEDGNPLPVIVGYCAYKLAEMKNSIRKELKIRHWLILNGMNAGRYTIDFGPHCIADNHDCINILKANQEWEELHVEPVTITVGNP